MRFENYLKLKILCKFYADTVLIICLHITYGQFMPRGQSWVGARDLPAHKTKDIYYLALLRESLLFPALCIDSIPAYFRLTHLYYRRGVLIRYFKKMLLL